MNDVIDAANRFGPQGRRSNKPSALDVLRMSKRIAPADRAVLASRLGEIAAKLSPERPHLVAKAWFDKAWTGDRWAKRKRLICFPGEVPPDPRDEGAFVASGGDWATLVELAAKALVTGAGQKVDLERARIGRDILRGTEFVPAAQTAPLRAESAQSLLVLLASKIVDAVEERTDLRHLWDVLETTPYAIESYDLEPPEQPADGAEVRRSNFRERFEGDSYSMGPLAAPSKLAAEASRYRYRQREHWGYRFEPAAGNTELNWAHPILRAGLRGHARSTRIFSVPPNFMDEIRPDWDPDEEAPEDLVHDWLIAKGLVSGDYGELPEMSFDPNLGIGWRRLRYETVQSVWFEVQAKPDGSPGVWVSAEQDDMPHFYPMLGNFDTLAVEAMSAEKSLTFYTWSTGSRSRYELFSWPSYRADFCPGGTPPAGAPFGLLDVAYEELPSVEGWLDDLENIELQDLLFRNPEGTRFCPSFDTSVDTPAPCRAGTIAAAIFQNAGAPADQRIGRMLVQQARTLSAAGLGFHEALLGHHRNAIAQMLND